jgi:kynurenine 3-monooxygenase
MDAAFPGFTFEKRALAGNFKVCRLAAGPPKLDPTSVALLLPSKGTTTVFVEPTINGSSCILFAGRDQDRIMEPSSNRTETVQAIVESFPLLEGCDLNELARQLETQSPSTASSVKSNIYHYGSIVALCGDAAHATGGVSGQGVNSALVDSSILADCLESLYDRKDKETSLQNALLAYSQRQVPEGYALYDLSFGPSPKGIFKRVKFGLSTARDTLFRGRLGIGEPPLQTLLTTSLKSFSDIRRDRNAFYDEPFPDASSFNQTLARVYSLKETTVYL